MTVSTRLEAGNLGNLNLNKNHGFAIGSAKSADQNDQFSISEILRIPELQENG